MKITILENLLFYYIGYGIFLYIFLGVLLQKSNINDTIPVIIFAQIYDIYYVMRFKTVYSNVLYIFMHIMAFICIPTYFLGIFLSLRIVIIFQYVNETFIRDLHAK